MKIDENELIAYHLDELSPLRKRAVRSALERDAALAAESEEIAETLRAFGGGATSVVDDALFERTWQRVRPSLAVLEPQAQPRAWRWLWASGAVFAALAIAMVMMSSIHRVPQHVAGSPAQTDTATNTQPAAINEAPVIAELETEHAKARRLNDRPGPLTTEPSDDAGLAMHLDSAERLLTQVSHQDGPLPVETRSEVHHLLLQNAVYQQHAQERGDFAVANVMDDLGRVLVSLDAAPPETASGADDFRLQMNVGGVLFDLRILGHNRRPGTE